MMPAPASNFKPGPFKPLRLGLALLCWLGLTLTACSDQAAPPTPSTPPAPATSTTRTAGSQPVASSNQPAPALSASGPAGAAFDCSRIFCFGMAQEPVAFLEGKFDPANLVDRSSLQIARQVYETLFEFKPGTMQYNNSSLVKFTRVSDDGLQYSIRLGKGLQFSDNTPLDAAAIKFNFDRWSDPGNIYHKGEFQTWSNYFGGFPGKLESVQVDAPNNIINIQLRQPMANLVQVLAMPQFGIVAPSAFNAASGELERSTGSNWYTVDKPVRTVETKYVVLSENGAYHRERYDPLDTRAPYVKSKKVVAVVLKQNQDGLEEVRKGTVGASDKVPSYKVPEALRDPSLRLLERGPLGVAFLGMNHNPRSPFSNITVRQAFAAAIDTRSLVRNYYSEVGIAAGGLLPPSALGYLEYPPLYDPDRARRLLANAGYNPSNPLTLDLWVLPVQRAYYPDPNKIARAIAADLARVGVTLTVNNSRAWPQFRKERLGGGMDLYMFGWQGQNGDPDEFLGEFFGKERGEGGYENPVLLRKLQEGLALPDLRDRRGPYKEAQDIIYEQLPVIPLAYVREMVAVRPNVQGFQPSPSGIENWGTVEVLPGGQK